MFQVASIKQGLLPVCEESVILGDVSYHDFTGIVNDDSEKTALAQSLGPKNKVSSNLQFNIDLTL